jgi:N-acetyl-alpha-D-muramate 1-phosphate uridylyltransferase
MSINRAWRPDVAFVLGAGLGTRMRHLTQSVPKPLVKLKGIALIDRVLDRIAEAGIPRAVVNVHYLADVLEAHLARRTTPAITISNERDTLLETGGGVLRALPLLGAEPFLIHNSDTVWIEGIGRNLERLCAAWNPDTMDSLMLLAPTGGSIGYDGDGDFDMNANGTLTRREHGRQSAFVFAGVSIAHPRLFDGYPTGLQAPRISLNTLWNAAIAKGRLHGLRLDGTWMHVGDPEAVIEAERRMTLEHAR